MIKNIIIGLIIGLGLMYLIKPRIIDTVKEVITVDSIVYIPKDTLITKDSLIKVYKTIYDTNTVYSIVDFDTADIVRDWLLVYIL